MIRLFTKTLSSGNLSNRLFRSDVAPVFSSLSTMIPKRFRSDHITRFGDYYQINFGGESLLLSRSEMLDTILSLEGLDNSVNIDDTIQDKKKPDKEKHENAPKDDFTSYNKDHDVKYSQKHGIRDVNGNNNMMGNNKYFSEYKYGDKGNYTKDHLNLSQKNANISNENVNAKTNLNSSKINPSTNNYDYSNSMNNHINSRPNSTQTKKEPLDASDNSMFTKTDIKNTHENVKSYNNYDVLNSILKLLDETQYKGDKMKLLKEFVDFTNMKKTMDKKFNSLGRDETNIPYKTTCDGNCDDCSYRGECATSSSSKRKEIKNKDRSDTTEVNYLYENDPILSDLPSSYILYPPPYYYQSKNNDSNHPGGCCCHQDRGFSRNSDEKSCCGSHQHPPIVNQNTEHSGYTNSEDQYHRFQNISDLFSTSYTGGSCCNDKQEHQSCCGHGQSQTRNDNEDHHCCGRCDGEDECCGRCAGEGECCGKCEGHDQSGVSDDYLDSAYSKVSGGCCQNYNRDNYYGHCSNIQSTKSNKHECCCENHPGHCMHEQQCEDGTCKCKENGEGCDEKPQKKQLKNDKKKDKKPQADQQSNECNDIWTDPPIAFK